MPHVLEHTDCPKCGRRHHFCLHDGEMEPGHPYEYVCPETGKPSSLQPNASGKRVNYPPQGAVPLKRASTAKPLP